MHYRPLGTPVNAPAHNATHRQLSNCRNPQAERISQRLSAAQFMWHAATRTFVAEASDLGLRPGQYLITLVSRYPARTTFRLVHTERAPAP